MSKPWIFMGVDRSHFSAKLRPAIRYKQIHHVEYPPDMERIMQRTGVGFVPVLFSPDEDVYQDTTDIIDKLEKRFPEPALIPAGPDGVVCRLFELYADEFFPTVSMRTRWAYPENEAELRRAFGAFSGNEAQGNVVADLMSSYLPMLGVTADTIPAIDAHTADMLAALDIHLASSPFLLGERLSLADCALMGPLYAHLYLDKVTREMLYNNYMHVCMWIERCNRPVPEQMGDWFDGAYPQSLTDVLGLIGQDAAPLLTALESGFQEWASAEAVSGAEAPRGIGSYTSTLRNVPFSAGVRPYVVWKIQRMKTTFASCTDNDQTRTGELFTSIRCDGLLKAEDAGTQLRKQEFKLVVV